jgi:L-threonylcarbamoyladenylate synthase
VETRVEIADFENWRAAAGEAVKVLRAGEIVAVPTETVYGLAADAFNPEAVAKVFAAKERPSFDPLIVHLAHGGELARVARVPEEIAPVVRKLTGAFWPGPLTLVLPKAEEVPDLVTSGLPTVAVRASKHEVMRAIVKELGNPVAAPSANRFGRISPTSAAAVLAELRGRIPLVIDGGACSAGLESTIVAIEPGEKRPTIRILRPGPVTREELRNFGRVVKAGRVTDRPEAPGGFESHYAPGTPLLLFDKPAEFEPEAGKRYGLLSYRGEPRDGYIDRLDWAEVEVLSPGNGKLAEAAVRLFFALRALDASGVDAIVAEPVSEVGLGTAIMDRLRRAAARKGD